MNAPHGADADSARLADELSSLRRALALRSFQLQSFFELSRELAVSLDESVVQDLLLPTLMGHLTVSRCALVVQERSGLRLAASRGLRLSPESAAALPALPVLQAPARSLECPEAAEWLLAQRLAFVVPAEVGATRGWLLLGARPDGKDFDEQQRDLAVTLARQGLTVLETVRLHRLRLEKQQQDRELALAREIQEALLPRAALSLASLQIAADSRPCLAVGGDYYDFIPLEGGRLALVAADVSGKGTPASLLMASVHATVRALAGTLPPAALMARVNRLLYDSTQPHRYVTLFYGEWDVASGCLCYVNAGHVPPWHVRGDGEVRRLEAGGVAPGLLEESAYEVGTCQLAPGELLLLVTDGVTEALSAADEEFGPARVSAWLHAVRAQPASEILQGLIEGVLAWCGLRGVSDDLTAVVVKRDP